MENVQEHNENSPQEKIVEEKQEKKMSLPKEIKENVSDKVGKNKIIKERFKSDNSKMMLFKEKAKLSQLSNERQHRIETNTIMTFMGKRLKIFSLFIFQLILIGFFLECFVFKKEATGRLSFKEFAVKHQKGEIAYIPMSQVRQFKNIKAIDTAKFASINGFPAECAEARELQRLMVGKYRLPLEVENSIGMRFRMIPDPKTKIFKMGSLENEIGRGNNEILHDVSLRAPFYMGKFEVTQKEWEQVRFQWDKIRKNPELLEAAKKLGNIPNKLIENGLAPNPSFYSMKFNNQLPINNVTWYEGYYFAIALSAIEGVKIGTYRLPLEREWEWACRGGSPLAYAFGNDPSLLNYFDVYGKNSFYKLGTVGVGLPNTFGLYNMHGNVYEWCYDVFHIYPGAKADDYDGITRVIRGGNYRLDAASCRCAERMRLGENSHGSVLGFRIVRTVYDGVYQQESSLEIEPDAISKEEIEKLNIRLVSPVEVNINSGVNSQEMETNMKANEIRERRE